MTLQRNLDVRSPLLWIKTSEPHIVINALTHYSQQRKRNLFRIDPFQGLIKLCEDGSWKQVLHDFIDDEGITQVVPIGDNFFVVFPHVLEERGILILENAHLHQDSIWPYLNHVVYAWVKMLESNDLNLESASVVMTAPDSEKIPASFSAYLSIVEQAYPNADEISYMVQTIVDNAGIKNVEVEKVTRALRGLSETYILNTVSNSLAVKGTLDPAFCNSEKIQVLSKTSAIEVRVPSVKIDDIGGMDNAKELLSAIAWTWNNPAKAQELHIDPIRKVVMIGIPGTGKSMICEAAADALNLDLASFGISKAMNKFVGESEANMRNMFKQVKAMAPVVAWIDEFGRDTSGGGSSNVSDSGTTDRVHGEFLTGLQELPEDVFMICAANRIDDLPPEMLRAERFDIFMFVGLPTQTEREEIFRIHLTEEEISRMNIEQLAKATNTFTGAEIKSLIRRARFDISARQHRPITTKDLGTLAPQMLNRVWIKSLPVIVESYQRALTDWDWASSSQYEEAGRVLDAAKGKAKV